MKSLLVLLVLLAFAGCAEQPTVRLIPTPEPSELVAIHTQLPEADPSGEPICDVLPDDGPCADACDYEALVEHVPQGVCAEFRCELTDGRVISVGACHP